MEIFRKSLKFARKHHAIIFALIFINTVGWVIYDRPVSSTTYVPVPVPVSNTAAISSAVSLTSTNIPSASAPVAVLPLTADVPQQTFHLQDDFVQAVSQTVPAVVVIKVTYGQGDLPGQPEVQYSAGTGFIIDSSGIIVTNYHVIALAQTITVVLADSRIFTAIGVNTDPRHDIAVIKINAEDLPVVSLGDSSSLNLAQRLVAIGNSLDMGIRITGGVVACLKASATYLIPGEGSVSFDNLIETDATINPGNSGGVLINSSGLVVGIVNVQLSGQGTDQVGFGYAIPINDALPIIENLTSQLT